MARLVANLPVLRGGHPPVVVPLERRGEYIDLLWEYQNAVGVIQRDAPFVPPHPAVTRFKALLSEEWQRSLALVAAARTREAERLRG